MFSHISDEQRADVAAVAGVFRFRGSTEGGTAFLTELGVGWIGQAALRASAWMPVLVAVRLNPWLRAYYWRLRRVGKRPKVAMIACMHKLLAAIYSVAKNRRPFVAKWDVRPVSALC